MQDTQDTWVPSLGWEDPLEEEIVFQHSCLENPMDRGAWWAIVPGVANTGGKMTLKEWVVRDLSSSDFAEIPGGGMMAWARVMSQGEG